MERFDFDVDFHNLGESAQKAATSGDMRELKRLSLEAVRLSKQAYEEGLLDPETHEDNMDYLARRILNALVSQ